MMKNYLKRKLLVLALLAPISFLMAQDVRVSGTVTDASNGEPIPGVTVLVKGTTNGAITGINGEYELSVPSDATLVFSSIGYSSVEVAASEAGDVSMQTDVTNLDEVVVTGLATSIKRSNLANNISTINSEALTGTTTGATLDGALYGKLTGVNINAAGGAPGGQTALRLRGVSSLSGNNQPLFIVDGVYISNTQLTTGSSVASGANAGREEGGSNRVSDINPEDIASIEVLKGASAAAIYGTRANAGVVIITTKRGQDGKTTVNFEQDFGFNEIQNYAGRRSFTREQAQSLFSAGALYDAAVAENGGLYNYEEELYGEKGFITDSRLSISGGNNKTKFYFNASRRDEDGIMLNTGYTRNSFRLNLDHNITDRLKIGTSTNYIKSSADRGPVGNENSGGYSVGYNLAFAKDWEDFFPDENGIYASGGFGGVNVIYNRDNIINSEDVDRLIQGVNAEYLAIQESNYQLKFQFNGGIDFFNANTLVYIPEDHEVQVGTTQGFLSATSNKSFQYNYNAFAVFDYFTGNDLSITTQVGMSYLSFESNFLNSQTTQLIPGLINAGDGGSYIVAQRLTEEEEFGIIGQSTANWGDKIILTAGVRFDKSNLNGDVDKFFAFPRASVAVNVANFDFWSVSAINQFKLRVAYGETGSSARFGSKYTSLGTTIIGGSTGLALTTNSQQLGAAGIEPETSQELEFGADFSFLDGKIGLEATYYERKVLNLIYPFSSIPLSSGFGTEIRNDFDLKNTGIELSLNANIITNENITWNSTLNWWKNKAEVESLGVGEFQPSGEGFNLQFGSAYIREGEPVTSLAAAQGTDIVIIGDAAPDFEMSWFNQITFLKDFDLTFLWHMKEGGDNLNLTRLLSDFGGTTPDLDDPNLTRSFGTDGPAGYIEDASYIRLREIGLFYTLPVESSVFQRVRVGISGKNLLTITDYSGYDPETSAFGPSGLSQGIEVAPFPSAKQFYFHLGLRF
ncbi:MAG: SusC/RagA family TonB-linked outer membrane protein [Ekhidna sp.]